jgi:hypothetical protein
VRSQEGRREDRVRAAPAVSRAKMRTAKSAHEHTGSAEAVRPSLRNGSTAYFVLSPARPGLFVTVIPKKRELLANLTPAIGASGPHDFAVRERLRSSFANSASTASHRAFRDVRNAPRRVGRTQYAGDLGQKQSGIFFATGLDRIRRAKVICPSGSRPAGAYVIPAREEHAFSCAPRWITARTMLNTILRGARRRRRAPQDDATAAASGGYLDAGYMLKREFGSSWPGLSRPSTSCLLKPC